MKAISIMMLAFLKGAIHEGVARSHKNKMNRMADMAIPVMQSAFGIRTNLSGACITVLRMNSSNG